MKKVFLICLLFIGLGSFPVNANISNLSMDLEITNSVIDGEVHLLDAEVFTVQVLNVSLISCTADVYYNGSYVTSFTRGTCGEAMHAACAYITARGGTCPIAN